MLTIIRATPGGFDEYGDPVDSTTSTHDIDGVLAPETSSPNDATGRSGVVVGLTLYTDDPSADVRCGDLVEYLGELWSVDGEIGVWRSPYGDSCDGLQVALRRGQG